MTLLTHIGLLIILKCDLGVVEKGKFQGGRMAFSTYFRFLD